MVLWYVKYFISISSVMVCHYIFDRPYYNDIFIILICLTYEVQSLYQPFFVSHKPIFNLNNQVYKKKSAQRSKLLKVYY